ncbi:MAG: hypothetical protein ING12_01880 [Roseomonas sp.]|nr:hypothetical protein [Roseomonas sp.]
MTNLSAIAFVGQNANGILAWWTQCIADRMAMYGISVETIDLLQEGWLAKLDALLKKKRPDFCFSFQGIGMGFSIESGNLWSSLKVPFISSMGDAPYYSPSLHRVSGAGLFHLYTSHDFYSFYRDFLNGKNLAAVLHFGYPSNLHADDIAWQKRDLELVFVKSGVNPEAIRAPWAELPKLMREVLEEASASALAGQTATIGQIVANAYTARQIHFGDRLALFLRSCQQVDSYVRAVRADRMARQVMRHGGHIFGDWPHLDKAKTKAVFHGTLPARDLNKLYARSRILVNTAPCTQTGVHERILAAFQAKAFILADGSPFLDEKLADYASFKSVPIESAEFADAVDSRLVEVRQTSSDPAATQAMLDSVQIKAEATFGLDQFITAMLEFLLLHRTESASAFYA